MKKIVQMFREGNEEWFLEGWKKWADKLIILEDYDQYDPEITLVAGTRFYDPFFYEVMKNKNPYIGINRPYLGAHTVKHRNQWRVSVNSFANFIPKSTPIERFSKLNLEYRDWCVSRVENILIAPPVKSIPVFLNQSMEYWAESMSHKFVNANVKIRYKEGRGKWGRYTTLWDDLDWADLVVSFSSAVTAEAFWYGKKVISLGICPTWMCQSPTLENWQDPTEPANRKEWHNHMGWIQFSNEEWMSGDAQEATLFYQGWPPDTPHHWMVKE